MVLRIAPAAAAGVGRVEVSFYQADAPSSPLVVQDSAGTRLGRSLALLEAFRIRDGAASVEPGVTFRFGELLASTEPMWVLECADDGLALRATWAWQALAEIETDYRFSLQLRSPDDAIIGQEDGRLGDAGVPTPLWGIGEVMPQQVTLGLPGRPASTPLSLYLAVYDPVSGARLPVGAIEGEAVGGDELFLGEWTAAALSAACVGD